MRSLAIAAFLCIASHCLAVDYEVRIVEQVGPAHDDYVVLRGDRVLIGPRSSHRLRIQFRAIPEPGETIQAFAAWWMGTIETTGGINTRSMGLPGGPLRGCVPPFSSSWGGTEGEPLTDPFVSLNTIGCAAPVVSVNWECGPDGKPGPYPLPPPPESRGVNVFISVYEITTRAENASFTISIGGNAIAALEWRSTECWPAECGDPDDPGDDIPTPCTFAVFPTPPQPVSYTLHVVVCPAEWNDDRAVTSQDFFDFLTDFFAGDADFNADGATTSADFFDYLTSYFTPC